MGGRGNIGREREGIGRAAEAAAASGPNERQEQ